MKPAQIDTDSPAAVAEFEARIARGETIEPKDWMPERYRKQLIRMMGQHAHSEGYEIMATLAAGTPAQKAMAQDALDRWWWPSIMMFGPSDTDSPHTGELLKWKVKRHSNDVLRQRFINLTVPQAKAIDLKIPDPAMYYDEATKNWISGPIDWDEFFQVIKGNGPCNRERLEARRNAHDDGAWVREAALAYASKQSARSVA